MEVVPTEATEEYLEAVYKLQQRDGIARTSEMVKLLNVVPGTVTNTIEKLEKEGLVSHVPYKGVKLTEKGSKIALGVIRRHRLSERLLTDVLHVSWYEAHKIACKLEHDLRGDVIRKIEEVLREPKTCPHGNPIPTETGEIIEEETTSMANLKENEKGVISKVMEEDGRLLKRISEQGLVPKASIEMIRTSTRGPFLVKISGVLTEVTLKIASVVKVKKSGGKNVIPDTSCSEKRIFPLTALRNGECGIIIDLLGMHGGSTKGSCRRLMDMGLVPGTKVTVVKSAPFRGPVEILVRDTHLVLGRGMAERVHVAML